MSRYAFALSMLIGAGLIVARPYWFVSTSFSCFDCFVLTEAEVIRDAVAVAAATFVVALTPAALAFGLWRRLMCLRAYGATPVTRDQSIALTRSHLGLRVLSNAITLLALIAGGLIIQLGYMS